jgi:hypothetical protein
MIGKTFQFGWAMLAAASVRPEVITHALGAFCYLCLRVGHSISSAARLAVGERRKGCRPGINELATKSIDSLCIDFFILVAQKLRNIHHFGRDSHDNCGPNTRCPSIARN